MQLAILAARIKLIPVTAALGLTQDSAPAQKLQACSHNETEFMSGPSFLVASTSP